MKLLKADLETIESTATEVERKNRTISLERDQYERFQKDCLMNDLSPNKVLDALIKLFLEARAQK